MNTKKLMLSIVPILVLAMIVCAPVMLAGCQENKKQQEDTSLSAGNENTPNDDQAADGPLQDSIFDDDSQIGGSTQSGSAGTSSGQQTQTPNNSGSSSESPAPGTTPDDNSDSTQPPSVDTIDPETLTYAQYHDMSATDQRLYMESFESVEAFFEWYNAAREKHEQENPTIDVGDGSIDLEELLGGNS